MPARLRQFHSRTASRFPGRPRGVYRTGLIYDKGALLLEALHGLIGEEKFLNVMRTIQGRYAWRFLTTNQVEEVFAHFDPKTDYHAFFQRYFWGKETPA